MVKYYAKMSASSPTESDDDLEIMEFAKRSLADEASVDGWLAKRFERYQS